MNMEKHLIWDFGKQFAREPILRRMPNGDLVCTFLTGGPTEPHNENVLQMSRSSDDGKTWSEPKTILAHSRRGVWCTELFAEGPDPFLVVMTYEAANHYLELQTYRSFSYDGGRTWEEPVAFPSGLNGVTLRQGIVLSNGSWLFPLYWQELRNHFDWGTWKGDGESRDISWPFCCGVARSEDGGKTFQRYGYLTGERSLWEPNCVELENGHVVILMRDNACGFLKRADSLDYGRTWSEPITTDIPNPNTKITLLKVGKNVLLINNFRKDMGWDVRTNLEIRVSEDGLKSFSRVLPLENREERWFYPHAYVDKAQETIYVAYENAREHRLAKVSFRELGL